jgi:tetratricopeptide (TPR) repeat protein
MSTLSTLFRNITLASLAMSLYLPASSAVAATSLELQSAFETQVKQISLKGASLDKVQEQLKTAKAQLAAFRASKDVKTVDENKWKLTREMEQQLLSLQLQAAEMAMDAKDYSRSMTFLKEAHELRPDMAITAYYQGLNYLAQNKTWDATRAFYTAKRLNAYPAQRKMTNPVKPWEVLTADAQRLNEVVDQELKKLGKDTEYPISLNFETGKNTDMKLVPGVGAHLQSPEGDFNLYLKDDMLKKALNHLGKPMDIQERTMRGQVLRFHSYDNLLIGVNPENHIERIQVAIPGYQVEVDNKMAGIGMKESDLVKMLGTEKGYEKLSSTDTQFSHVVAYNDYGVSFGITPAGTVGVISIWTLE